MTILFDAPKSKVPAGIAWTTTIFSLLCLVYALWPETPKREGVVLSNSARALLVHNRALSVRSSFPRPEVEYTHSNDPDAQMLQVARAFAVPASPPLLRPLPLFGVDAVGSPRAWDGRSEDGIISSPDTEFSATHKDRFGNPCYRDPNKVPIDTLRLLSPLPREVDRCGYRSALLYQDGRQPIPSYFFRYSAIDTEINTYDISEFMESGKWSIADLEELVRQKYAFSPIATVNLYIILKEGNSPMATEFVSSRIVNREYLDEYLETGKCPLLYEVKPYCFNR
jgi:hypothetical protein